MKTTISVVMSVVLTAVVVGTAHGQNGWQSLDGPWEASSPEDISVGYSGSVSYTYAIGGPNRQLLFSTSEGDTWSPTGTPKENVVAVACVTTSPSTVYVANSNSVVSKSTNGGQTWTDQWTFSSPVARIAISPHNSNTIYVGLGGQQFDVNQPLWRSTNAGTNWTVVSALNIYAKITQIAFDPSNPSIIYVTARGTISGVWRSNDGGGTWFPKNNGLGNTQIKSLGVTPTQSSILYAGTYQPGTGTQTIYKSLDYGENWSATPAQLGAADIVVDPARANVVYATTQNGVLRSMNSGRNWVNKSTGILSRIGRRLSIVEGGYVPARVLLGTWAAFYRTNDDAEHWAEKTKGMALVACYGVATRYPNVYSVAYGHQSPGAFANRSVDFGSSWQGALDNSVFGDPSTYSFFGFDIAVDPTDPNVLLASGTSTFLPEYPPAPNEFPEVLFRSSDGGDNWTGVYVNQYANQVANIVFDGADHHYAYSADFYHVLRSADNGVSWEQLENSPGEAYAIAIGSNSGTPSKVLYAGGSWRIQKSDDGGKSWNSMSNGLPSGVMSITAHPTNPAIVWAGTVSDRVYWTTNGGTEWVPRRNGIYRDYIQSLLIDPTTNVLYAVAADYAYGPNRVYRSTNLGETWQDISGGLNQITVYDLSLHPTYPDFIFAATSNGIYRYIPNSYQGTITQNTTWSGTVYVTGALDIVAGATLTVLPGTTVKVFPNVNITVSGILHADGNNNNRITFTSSTSSTTWSGLLLYGSGANGSTLTYVTMEKVSTTGGAAINVVGATGVSIQYCTLSNNTGIATNGISFWDGGSPDVAHNTIGGHPGWGVSFSNTNGYFYANTLQGNSSGAVRCTNGASPMFGKYGFPAYNGNNHIAGGAYGVYAYSYSYPYVGSQYNSYYGYNAIDANSVARVSANYYCDILAEQNWWGSSSPGPSWFQVSQSSIDWQPFLLSNPFDGGQQDQLANPPTSVSLRSASEQRAVRNYPAARAILQALFSNQPSSIEALQAGTAMLHLFRDTTDNALFTFMQAAWQQHRRSDPAFCLIIANMLAMQGRIAQSVDRYADVIRLGRNTHHEKIAWLNLFYLYFATSQLDLASHILDTLQAKYTGDLEVASASWLLRLRAGSPVNSFGRIASQGAGEKPTDFALMQNYPNPFNPSTIIKYALPIDSHVTIRVYDILGREVATLVDGYAKAGHNQVTFNASMIASGVYFYRLEAEGFIAVQKMLALK